MAIGLAGGPGLAQLLRVSGRCQSRCLPTHVSSTRRVVTSPKNVIIWANSRAEPPKSGENGIEFGEKTAGLGTYGSQWGQETETGTPPSERYHGFFY
eukprot:1253967-Rhodomonas_salina.2